MLQEYRNISNMGPFNYSKSAQWLGLKEPENLQIMIGWCLDTSKEWKWIIIKYKHGNDWTVSRMNPYMEMTEL